MASDPCHGPLTSGQEAYGCTYQGLTKWLLGLHARAAALRVGKTRRGEEASMWQDMLDSVLQGLEDTWEGAWLRLGSKGWLPRGSNGEGLV